MSKTCLNCGATIDDDALFCSECGKKQEPVEKKCKNCGAVLPEGSKFCMNCGTPVAQSASAAAVTPSNHVPKQGNDDYEVSQTDENTLSFNIKGIPFNMKLIKGGMLGNAELTDFYIGETAVTQALWQTVTGSNPAKDISDLQFPITNVDRQKVKPFLVSLKKITGKAFDIPTASQFIYAAKKGCENMTEAEFDEMIWGDDKIHPVCRMMPNRFGLYDLADWCQLVQDEGPTIMDADYRLNPKYDESEVYYAYLDANKKDVDVGEFDIDSSEFVFTLRLVITIPVSPEVEKDKYDAAARRKAAEQAQKEEEQRRRREEEERKKAEAKARREEAKRKKEEEERLKREEEERLKSEERARKEEERRKKEEEKKKKQEEKARLEAEHPEWAEERKRKQEEKKKQQALKEKEVAKRKAAEEAERKAKEAAEQKAIEAAKKKILEDDKLKPVDLGLSVKWASLNLGASKLTDYGGYYAWGETETKDVYDWEEYEFSDESDNHVMRMLALDRRNPALAQEMWKYCTDSDRGEVDDLSVLEFEDDAAAVNMRSKLRFWEKNKWRMPTIEEWNELKEKCKWVWTSINGCDGCLVIAKNGNCIFLPAAGYKDGNERRYVKSAVLYWSSSLNKKYNYQAHVMEDSSNPLLLFDFGGYRCLGLSIRAVQE